MLTLTLGEDHRPLADGTMWPNHQPVAPQGRYENRWTLSKCEEQFPKEESDM